MPLCLATVYHPFFNRINFLRLLKWRFWTQGCHKHLWGLHQRRMDCDYFFNTALLIPVVGLFSLLLRTCMRRNLDYLRLLGFQRCPLDCNVNLVWWFRGSMLIFKNGLYIRFEDVGDWTLCVFLVSKVAFDYVPVHLIHLH